MAYVSMIVSGAACLGVLLGLVSGIFFLILAAVKWVSRVRSSLYEEELARHKKFLASSSCLLGPPDYLEARNTDNSFGSTLSGQAQRETEQSFQRSLENPVCQNELPTHHEKQDPGSDTIKVRELMEKMVETMIGGPLDGTTVGQLSTHSEYLDMFTRYHNLLCRELARLGFALHLSLVHKNEDSTEVKDSNLKRLIKQIMNEATDLPNLKDSARSSQTPKEAAAEDFESKSYEDILATAILNKVIENFQKKSYKESEPLEETPKPRVRHRKPRRCDTHDDPKSDGDWSDTSRSDQLSLTIEEYIEEVTTGLEGSEDERSELSDVETSPARRIPFPESGRTVVDAGTDDENSDVEEQSAATELVTSTNSWEENWLFQKKRLQSTPNAHHPVPVPMLVPNPSEDFRALVGGVDADDLSDMSECSDSALEELITTEMKPVEVAKADYSSGEEMIGEKSSEKVKVILTHITEESFLKKLGGIKDGSCGVMEVETNEGVEEGSQQAEKSCREDASATEEHIPFSGSVAISASTDSEDSLIRCRVAEREKEKWMNPVPLPDNPYSLENIEKREQQRRINHYFRIGTFTGESIDFPDDPVPTEELLNKKAPNQRFTRDYYVNASKHPSGMSSSLQRADQSFQSASSAFPKTPTTITITNMLHDNANGKSDASRRCVIDKGEYCLPSVKELAKHFTEEDLKRPNDDGSQAKLESKHKSQCHLTNSPEKEFEVDYSMVPVSEIILNLQQATESHATDNRKQVTYDNIQPATRMEILRRADGNGSAEKQAINSRKADDGAKYNGKQVHSLTARSISKEFREGLKNNSYQKVFPKIDRTSSGGESDQGDVIHNKTKLSPTPSIDLKNMKKFWEEIIMANSNSTKQK